MLVLESHESIKAALTTRLSIFLLLLTVVMKIHCSGLSDSDKLQSVSKDPSGEDESIMIDFIMNKVLFRRSPAPALVYSLLQIFLLLLPVLLSTRFYSHFHLSISFIATSLSNENGVLPCMIRLIRAKASSDFAAFFTQGRRSFIATLVVANW